MNLDFGVTMGHIVFTDNGGDRVERALFGHRFAAIADETIYDIFGDEEDLTDYIKMKGKAKFMLWRSIKSITIPVFPHN